MLAHEGRIELPSPSSAQSRHSVTIRRIKKGTQPQPLRKLGKRAVKQFSKGSVGKRWQAPSTRHSHPKPRSRRTCHALPGFHSPRDSTTASSLPTQRDPAGVAGVREERQDWSMPNFLYSPGMGGDDCSNFFMARPVGKAGQILRLGRKQIPCKFANVRGWRQAAGGLKPGAD